MKRSLLPRRGTGLDLAAKWREWWALGRLPLQIAHIRMDVGCFLLGHKWVEFPPGRYCDRCLRTVEADRPPG